MGFTNYILTKRFVTQILLSGNGRFFVLNTEKYVIRTFAELLSGKFGDQHPYYKTRTVAVG